MRCILSPYGHIGAVACIPNAPAETGCTWSHAHKMVRARPGHGCCSKRASLACLAGASCCTHQRSELGRGSRLRFRSQHSSRCRPSAQKHLRSVWCDAMKQVPLLLGLPLGRFLPIAINIGFTMRTVGLVRWDSKASSQIQVGGAWPYGFRRW